VAGASLHHAGMSGPGSLVHAGGIASGMYSR
jgi:hypothetical protein